MRTHLDNPFLVLDLPVESSRAEIERQGAKLLGMLATGLPAAAYYETLLGRRLRTPESIRTALAELRDPAKRLARELWVKGLRP